MVDIAVSRDNLWFIFANDVQPRMESPVATTQEEIDAICNSIAATGVRPTIERVREVRRMQTGEAGHRTP